MEEKTNYKKQNLFGWVKNFSVGSKLSIIIVLIIIMLLIEFGSIFYSIKTISGIRVFIVGQDFWSKARKDINRYIVAYSTSRNESDYDKILSSESVYYGFHNARVEIGKPKINFKYLREQFMLGGLHSDDISDAVFLFRTFKNVSYVDNAIKSWVNADIKFKELIDVSEKLHQFVIDSYKENDPKIQAQINLQIESLMVQANSLDDQSVILEKNYTNLLSQASRTTKTILIVVNAILTLLLGIFAVSLARIIQKTTIQVDTAKSEFVSWASHQLRTPITSVKWRSEMLLKGKVGELNDKQRGYIEEIYHGNERMIKLVGSLLSMAHIEMGKFKIVVKQVDIKSLLSDIIKEQQQEIEKRNQTITINEANPTPAIFSDPILITNIFQNLLSNAIKYTPVNGQISCTIKTQEGKVQFEFKDNGIGIPEAEQKRIFEKTFRASNALEQNREGNGLGMYIIKGMIEALGGKIWFKSKLNEGTTFYLELPVNILNKKKLK